MTQIEKTSDYGKTRPGKSLEKGVLPTRTARKVFDEGGIQDMEGVTILPTGKRRLFVIRKFFLGKAKNPLGKLIYPSGSKKTPHHTN